MILAGGRGKRLNNLSDSRNKCVLMVQNKPLIEYSLDCAVNIDVNEIVIVVGYKAEDIINRYGNNYRGKKIKYILQKEQKGLVNAIECAKEALEKDDFMLFLADEVLVNPRHKEMLEIYKRESLFGVCGVLLVDDVSLISKTYSIIQDEHSRIYRLIEKPKKVLHNIMGTGNCVFKNEILSYIDQTPINQKRQEKELPDLIQCAIDEGFIIKSFILCEKYENINSKTELDNIQSYFEHL